MSEIEEQFFETFGIKPKKQCYYWDCPYSTCKVAKDTPINERDCANCINPYKEVYPQITDHILLELICLTGNTNYFLITNEGTPIDVDRLKNSVLHSLTIYSEFHKGLKQKVQALFKENN